MKHIYDDGGRKAAGYRGPAGDCAVRAIAIATRESYQSIYDELYQLSGESPRNGTYVKYVHQLLGARGWTWTPTMLVGAGCTVHLRADELPPGRIIVRLSKHYAAVIDGTVRDTHNPSRGGTRCVYGYWSEPNH